QFGKQLDRLCVVLKGEYTPTDSLIVRYLMIMNDEENFKKIAIVHRVHTQRPQHQPVERTIQAESLPDIYKRLKHSQH
ncbi:hypothetical protein, partial [Enterococcus faecalis]|uniref:hypothetical protein n=1 Tax=Enterococcus faecalis TaxID=1351 RepID=UPI00403F5B11